MSIEGNKEMPSIGSGVENYSRLGKYISTTGLKFKFQDCMPIEKMKEYLKICIPKVGFCTFNDRLNNPIRLKKNGEPKKGRKVIDSPNFDGPLINFNSYNDELWKNDDNEGVYFITFNGFIVKIGMTETSFEKRSGSYICGSRKAMKKGSCSTTNFVICEVCYTALQLGINVDIYGINIQKERREIEVYGQKTNYTVSVVRSHEEIITNIYKENIGKIPPLCVQHASNTSSWI